MLTRGHALDQNREDAGRAEEAKMLDFSAAEVKLLWERYDIPEGFILWHSFTNG